MLIKIENIPRSKIALVTIELVSCRPLIVIQRYHMVIMSDKYSAHKFATYHAIYRMVNLNFTFSKTKR